MCFIEDFCFCSFYALFKQINFFAVIDAFKSWESVNKAFDVAQGWLELIKFFKKLCTIFLSESPDFFHGDREINKATNCNKKINSQGNCNNICTYVEYKIGKQ